jgi:branched-chain amino acid transport system substrate-binding protein
MPPPSFRRFGLILALAGLVLLASCSVLVTGGRCATDGDCAGRSVAAVCLTGACVAKAVAVGGSDGGGSAVRSCNTNSECAARLGDEMAVCEKVGFTCVKLTSEDCTKVRGDWKNDRAIYVGTLFKQGASAGDPGASPDALAAIELAFDEIKNDKGGLPSTDGGPARPLVAVECNQTQDAVRAARFLSEQVRVPAILGAASTYVTIQVASQVTVPSGTFLISPYASSPGLTTLDDKGLVWRTYPSDALQARAVPLLVNEILASPSFTTARAPRTKFRIGVVYKQDNYGEGLRDIILARLAFNGQSATANLADGALKLFPYPNTEDPAYANYDFTEVAAKVVTEAQPFDLLMLLGTSEVADVFTYAESHWPSAVLPYYVMPDGIASSRKLATAIFNVVDGVTITSKSVRRRIRGTIVNRFTGPLFEDFSLKFAPNNAVNGANAYDAAYVVAYALYGVGDAPLTGANVAKAMSKLVGPGDTKRVGPADLTAVLQGIGAGGVSLEGTSGRLDFDLATGDVKATGASVWCLGEDDGGDAILVPSTGQTYDAVGDKLVGTFPDAPSGSDPCRFK